MKAAETAIAATNVRFKHFNVNQGRAGGEEKRADYADQAGLPVGYADVAKQPATPPMDPKTPIPITLESWTLVVTAIKQLQDQMSKLTNTVPPSKMSP